MISFIRSFFTSRSSSYSEMSKQLVEAAIKNNKVVVFSKSYCPYCIKAKKILSGMNVEFKAFELDQEPNGNDIQSYLASKTNQRTVPNIFIKEKHVGGCSDLEEAKADGSLARMLS